MTARARLRNPRRACAPPAPTAARPPRLPVQPAASTRLRAIAIVRVMLGGLRPRVDVGAGAGCDGQVLVSHDLLGLFERFTPKFVKKYADLHAEMQKAFSEYIADVQAQQFPAAEHSIMMDAAEWSDFLHGVEPEAQPA